MIFGNYYEFDINKRHQFIGNWEKKKKDDQVLKGVWVGSINDPKLQ